MLRLPRNLCARYEERVIDVSVDLPSALDVSDDVRTVQETDAANLWDLSAMSLNDMKSACRARNIKLPAKCTKTTVRRLLEEEVESSRGDEPATR